MDDSREDAVERQSIVITNLPKRVKQYELEALFSPVPGTVAVKLMNSKYGGEVRDGESAEAAFLLMTNAQTAQGLMASEWKHNAYCRDKQMNLEYAHERLESQMIPKVFPHDQYWLCAACHVDNAPKRDVCVSCHALRSIGCEFVDPSVPTRMIRISNIDRSALEKDVEAEIHSVCAVHSVTFTKDHITGHHKGKAYCRCFSVDDAIKIFKQLEGRSFGGRGQLCSVEFCVERFSDIDERVHDTKHVEKGPSAVQEQHAWEPAEFLADGEPEDHQCTQTSEQYPDLYYYDKKSGYYWHTRDRVWGTKDPITGGFVPYMEPNHPDENNTQVGRSTSGTSGQRRTLSSQDKKSSAAVVAAKPQLVSNQSRSVFVDAPARNVVVDTSQGKTVQGVIHAGKWAAKKKIQKDATIT